MPNYPYILCRLIYICHVKKLNFVPPLVSSNNFFMKFNYISDRCSILKQILGIKGVFIIVFISTYKKGETILCFCVLWWIFKHIIFIFFILCLVVIILFLLLLSFIIYFLIRGSSYKSEKIIFLSIYLFAYGGLLKSKN